MARQVASEGDALVAGGFSPVRPFSEDKSKEHIQAEFKKQADVFQEKKVDCLLGEVGLQNSFISFILVVKPRTLKKANLIIIILITSFYIALFTPEGHIKALPTLVPLVTGP